MKRCLAFSVLLSLLGAAAFADGSITLKGAADVTLVPLQMVMPDGEKAYFGAGLGGVDSDSRSSKVRIDIAGNMDDKIGFRGQLDVFRNSGSTIATGIGDFVEVWWKPIDMLKFDVGRFNVDVLRGKVGYDDWANFTVSAQNKDAIFTRFRGDVGSLVSLTPIPGLFVGVLVPSFAKFDRAGTDGISFVTGGKDGNTTGDGDRALRVFERIQAAVGYELSGIGLVRAQFVGANGGFKEDDIVDMTNPASSQFHLENSIGKSAAPRFEFAFAFTGMEGLVIDFGVKAYIPIKDWLDLNNTWDPVKEEYTKVENSGTLWKGLQFALGAAFNTGALKISARVDALNIAANYDNSDQGIKFSSGPTIKFHLWPSYDLGICELGVDFGLKLKLQDTYEVVGSSFDVKNDDFQVGFGLWAKKTYGNGSIRGGLAYRLGNHDDGIKHPGVLSVPIIFDYSF